MKFLNILLLLNFANSYINCWIGMSRLNKIVKDNTSKYYTKCVRVSYYNDTTWTTLYAGANETNISEFTQSSKYMNLYSCESDYCNGPSNRSMIDTEPHQINKIKPTLTTDLYRIIMYCILIFPILIIQIYRHYQIMNDKKYMLPRYNPV